MRIRRKPWARPELAVCPYFYENAYAQRGHWHTLFTRPQPMYLELGIGKGAFIAQAAAAHPEINYMGVDIKSDVIGVARRRIEAEFAAGDERSRSGCAHLHQFLQPMADRVVPQKAADASAPIGELSHDFGGKRRNSLQNGR